jgi:hypothetical protein
MAKCVLTFKRQRNRRFRFVKAQSGALVFVWFVGTRTMAVGVYGSWGHEPWNTNHGTQTKAVKNNSRIQSGFWQLGAG